MNLDTGLCSVFLKVDTTKGVGMPRWRYDLMHQSWYGKLEFATGETYPTEYREEIRCDLRIRIHQNDRINNHCVVVLGRVDAMNGEEEHYNVTRAWHGHDEESGELITDMTLERITP